MPPTVPKELLQTISAAVVTGGSSGLGKSFIRLLQTGNPAMLVCNLSRREPCADLGENSARPVRHFPCDLARPERIAAAAGEVLAALAAEAPAGRVLLVNNGGVGGFGSFPAPSAGRQLEIVDVNVRAVVDLTARLLPCLRRRGGAIINVASVVAYLPTPFCATYGASKAFLLNWSHALGEELRGSGVRVLALSPGTTRTGFFEGTGATRPEAIAVQGMAPDDVVAGALRALAAGRASFVPGIGNRLAAAAAAWLPRSAAARLAR
ncbi:MAG: SDR family NAD(P)-dependent oxidoreductase, partial [Opitutaceae bacterium]|nr:SDR family NAD(P)-dependent oxidoreductase [Opitutaceae bacterium]